MPVPPRVQYPGCNLGQPRYFLTQEMLAMALLLPGGHLGGLGGTAREVGGSGEGVLTPPTVRDGFRWGVETGELAHLLPPCLFLAFARPASVPWALLDHRTRNQPPY